MSTYKKYLNIIGIHFKIVKVEIWLYVMLSLLCNCNCIVRTLIFACSWLDWSIGNTQWLPFSAKREEREEERELKFHLACNAHRQFLFLFFYRRRCYALYTTDCNFRRQNLWPSTICASIYSPGPTHTHTHMLRMSRLEILSDFFPDMFCALL